MQNCISDKGTIGRAGKYQAGNALVSYWADRAIAKAKQVTLMQKGTPSGAAKPCHSEECLDLLSGSGQSNFSLHPHGERDTQGNDHRLPRFWDAQVELKRFVVLSHGFHEYICIYINLWIYGASQFYPHDQTFGQTVCACLWMGCSIY